MKRSGLLQWKGGRREEGKESGLKGEREEREEWMDRWMDGWMGGEREKGRKKGMEARRVEGKEAWRAKGLALTLTRPVICTNDPSNPPLATSATVNLLWMTLEGASSAMV
jgi:hypothetical protein